MTFDLSSQSNYTIPFRSQQQAKGDDDDDDDEEEETNETTSLPWDADNDLTSPSQAETSLDLDDLLDANCLSANKQTTPRIRRHYTFKETIQNLHRGRPAYGALGQGLQKGSKTPAQTANHDGDRAYEPSFLSGPAGRVRLAKDTQHGRTHAGREDPRSTGGQTQHGRTHAASRAA